MKFTKEQAVKELTVRYAKPRYGEPDKWKRTIEESVEHAMKLIGEESNVELEQFVGFVMPFLETTAGFVLKETSDVATGLNKQIEELKKQVAGGGGAKNDDVNKELLSRIEALEKERDEASRSAKVALKKGEIARKLKEKGVKDQEWVNLMLNKSFVNEDSDVEKEANDFLEIYNKMNASSSEDYTPTSAKGNPSQKISDIIKQAEKIAKDTIV